MRERSGASRIPPCGAMMCRRLLGRMQESVDRTLLRVEDDRSGVRPLGGGRCTGVIAQPRAR